MRFQAATRCLMASVWWGSDLRLSTLGLILVTQVPAADLMIPEQRARLSRESQSGFDLTSTASTPSDRPMARCTCWEVLVGGGTVGETFGLGLDDLQSTVSR